MNDTPATPPFVPFHPAPPLVPSMPAPPQAAPSGKPRKPRTPKAPKTEAPKLKAHAPKFDLQVTLAAAKMLNESDFTLFEKLVVLLDEAGKPQRDRVLGAIGKVFAT